MFQNNPTRIRLPFAAIIPFALFTSRLNAKPLDSVRALLVVDVTQLRFDHLLDLLKLVSIIVQNYGAENRSYFGASDPLLSQIFAPSVRLIRGSMFTEYLDDLLC